MIIAVNLVLKKLIIAGITWVGEDTNSQQLSSITNGVFVAQFFNTGILLLLINGNMTEHSPSFLTKNIQGPFYDYMPDWYTNVGSKIVQTMMINAILPYVGLVTAFVIPGIKRKLDRGFGNKKDKEKKDIVDTHGKGVPKDIYDSKKTSLGAYRDLYSGVDYVIHFKYSGMLNIMYITMMYGLGMPILFPLAAFNYFNQYLCERIIVSYCCKQPPALDDKLTKNCIEKLKWSPILFLFNGYWMLSDRQIFQNNWSIIQNTSEKMMSHHQLYLGVNWAAPILLLCFSSIFLIVIQKIFSESLQKWGFALQEKDITVDEDLPNFFKCIRLSQANEVIAEEENMKNNFGFSYNDGDTIEELKKIQIPKKAIQGTPWYQALSNPKYSFLFNYTGVFIEERHKLIEDGVADDKMEGQEDISVKQQKERAEQSDMVMFLLNLAYVPDEVIRGLQDFTPGWQEKLSDAMKMNQRAFTEKNKENEKYPEGWRFQDGDMEDDYKEFYMNVRETNETVKQDRAEDKKNYDAAVKDLKLLKVETK